jgi:hypothetical protein
MVNPIPQAFELINNNLVHTVIEILDLEVDVSDLVSDITA